MKRQRIDIKKIIKKRIESRHQLYTTIDKRQHIVDNKLNIRTEKSVKINSADKLNKNVTDVIKPIAKKKMYY